MKHWFVWIVSCLLSFNTALAQQSHQTMPSATSSTFNSRLQDYLLKEPGNRHADMLSQGFIVSGGLHATDGDMVSAAFATVAYSGSGHYINQSSAAIDYSAAGCSASDTAWVIVLDSTSGALSNNFTRVSGTRYAVNCTDTSRPQLPTGSAWLMQVTISGSALSTVTDIRLSSSEVRTGIADITDRLYSSAVCDGVVDDTSALATAIATGRSFDFGNRICRTTTSLSFNKSNVVYRAKDGGGIQWDGANTTRLGVVTGSNVLFDGFTFDGNTKQPSGFLLYVGPNADRVQFRKVTFKNLLGTGTGSNLLNNMAAVGISPVGVTNYLFDGCRFENIEKVNDGSGFPAAAGLGGAQGIFLINEDYSLPVDSDNVSYGTVTNTHFEGITTRLAAGLSEADRIEFDDGDAMRAYCDYTSQGLPNGLTRSPLIATNLSFHNISKRASKWECAGFFADNWMIRAHTYQYGMVSVMKTVHEAQVSHIRAWATASKPIIVAFQMQGHSYLQMKGLFVDFVKDGIQVLYPVAGATLTHLTYQDVQFPNTEVYCVEVNQGNAAASNGPITIDGLQCSITDATNGRGIHLEDATNGTGNFLLNNVQMAGGSVRIEGTNNRLTNSRFYGWNTSYVGPNGSTTAALLTLGVAKGLVGANYLSNVEVDASGISDTYINAGRPGVVIVIHDRAHIRDLTIRVPETEVVTNYHGFFTGDDLLISGLNYYGAGSLAISTATVVNRAVIERATRWGNAATSTAFLTMNHASTTNVVLRDIVDFRPTTTVSLSLSTGVGAGNYQVDGVKTNSSHALGAVSSSSTAVIRNVNRFSTPTFANLGTPENGTEVYCSDCTVTSGSDNTCTSGGTGAVALRLATVWRCFNAQN